MYGLTTLETGITPPRLANLISYSWICSELPGAFAEFGVCKGGSLDLLSKLHPEKFIYGIDSFEGLPEPGKFDTHHHKGDFALTEEELFDLKNYFYFKEVILLNGFSPEVFKFIPSSEKFAFVHVDVDLYQSVKDALDFFYPRLVQRGMMIFDDYGFGSTPGAKKAIDEWKGECSYRGELFFADNLFCGQYLIIK